MNQTEVTGIVLSALPIGEYDKRIVILTKEKGKISAFARGARRPNSQLAGAVMPFSFGKFSLYEGRSSYTVGSASIANYFSELLEDVTAAYYAYYFVDVADYCTREGNDEREMLKLLYQTFRALVKKTIPFSLIRAVYELKTVTINGEGPQVYQCVVCGTKDKSMKFSVKRGGLICDQCNKGVMDAEFMNPSTLYTFQYVVSSPIEKLYTFRLSDEVMQEFIAKVKRYVETYMDHRFKSLEILKELEALTREQF